MKLALIARARVLPYWFLLVVSCLPFTTSITAACNFDSSGVCTGPKGVVCTVITGPTFSFCASPPDSNDCVLLAKGSIFACYPTKDSIANGFCGVGVGGCSRGTLVSTGSCQSGNAVSGTTYSKTCVAAPGDSFTCADDLSASGDFLGCIQTSTLVGGSGGIPPELFFPGGTLPPDFFPTNPVETYTPSAVPSSLPSAQPDSRKHPRKVIQAIVGILSFAFIAAKQAIFNDSP